MSDYSSSLLGQTLSDRYRLESQIGAGGQAVVWSGTDTESGQVRAIKLLQAGFNTPQRMIDSFRDEGLLLVNLDDHENIVKVYDAGYDANLRAFYMVIDYVDGATLADLIDAGREHAANAGHVGRATENDKLDSEKTQLQTGDDVGRDAADHDKTEYHAPGVDDGDEAAGGGEATSLHDFQRVLTPALSVTIVRQIALALDHAHRHGLIHRDVKPSNILLGRNGDVKLTDFGIARLAGESGQTGMIIGTLHYMSPEQIRGHKLDLRTDVYSLGIVLYECLTGRTPFSFAERQFIPTHVVNTAPQPPAEINAEVSPALQAIVLKALAKKPEDRYQTMTEFEDALVGLVNSGALPVAEREQIAAGVAPLTGSIDVIQIEAPGKLDSNQRCPTCGVPLPVGWQSALSQCPGCAGPLDAVADRDTKKVAEFIREARRKRDIGPGKVGLDMAMFLYSRELQAPTFEEWQQKAAAAEQDIQKGTVVMPAPAGERPKGSDLLVAARQLMAAADFLTDPELAEYNQRIPERYESDALAAHARAKAYQLLGRHHTLRGSNLTDPAEATAAYNNARHTFILAGEQYQRAAAAWRKYESSAGYERIEQYYGPVRDETQQRRLWAEVADLLTQGILRFPHDRQESYANFRAAAEMGRNLQPVPGIALDLKVAELYDNYYENALRAFESHLSAAAKAQTDARQIIATAQTADAALLAEDRRRVAGWLRDRARIALDYYHKQEDLPVALNRIRVLARLAGYGLAFVLAMAFIGEARHVLYTVDFPGPFWPGWPMILAQSAFRGYSLNFGSWHFFLVMLAGIDWLIFWPFNLVAARQTPRARRTGRTRPVIPALSQLALPIIDWLDEIARRGLPVGVEAERAAESGEQASGRAEESAESVESEASAVENITIVKRDAPQPESAKGRSWAEGPIRFLFFIAPWVPVLWLSWHLMLAFGDTPRPFPGNYFLWLFALFLGPPIAGYFVGRRMRQISEKLDRLEADEAAEHESLDHKTLLERERLRRERDGQAATAKEAFARANAEHDTHRAAIVGTLQVLLARLLHHQEQTDFVDLDGLDDALRRWRGEVDQSFLRRMGLKFRDAEVLPVSEAVWRVERPLDALPVKSRLRPVPLRFVHNQDGYVLWGTDGFQAPRRERLQHGPDGYSLAVELPPDARQVDFTFETADHRWPGETHTIWIEDNRKG